jgi:hypothetical protein
LAFLFALTLFASAALLFVVQPMIGKMVLPVLGGSPAVWSTCMVFFQAALLAGYAYAHATSAWLGRRGQLCLHACFLFVPLFFLPFTTASGQLGGAPSGSGATIWLLGLLVIMAGSPFFVVSTTAPLLQRWFSMTGHRTAGDPYFLYSASNAGSMLALLGYPLVIEPRLGLGQQAELWATGYAILIVLVLACALMVWRASPELDTSEMAHKQPDGPGRPGIGLCLRWIVLALVPSSLLLGVTMFVTTDLAPIPLLWVIPLALYLLSFIMVFASRPILLPAWMNRTRMGIALVALILCGKTTQCMFIPVHYLVFFLVARACHGELARLRPAAQHLTAFYLAMSVGGVAGGIFNALLAPHLFRWVAEYPLALVLACLVLPQAQRKARNSRDRMFDFLFPLALGLGLLGVGLTLARQNSVQSSGEHFGLTSLFGLALFLCFIFEDRPVRFGLGVGVVLFVGHLIADSGGRVLDRERNFFGVLEVSEDSARAYRRLLHGTTMHGQQSLDPSRHREPLTYYHRTGPIGQVFEELTARRGPSNVAILGLGAGSLAAYATPEQSWTFYEIDEAVVRIARDTSYFTYMADCRARSCQVVLGDARLRLRDAPDSAYGIIVLDAFSSDAIPTHLLTREALQVYRSKLAEGGLIALHISNRYIDLAPVLAALAADANLHLRVRFDSNVAPVELQEGKMASIWAVMAAAESDFGALASDARWKQVRVPANEAVWTDDFSNVVEHMMIRLK